MAEIAAISKRLRTTKMIMYTDFCLQFQGLSVSFTSNRSSMVTCLITYMKAYNIARSAYLTLWHISEQYQ